LLKKAKARGQPLTKSADRRYIEAKARIPMADNVTNELLLENLKAIQTTLAEHSEKFSRMEHRLATVEGYIAVLVKQGTAANVDFAALTARVERIERRLSLSDS
jgi:hypothetical protein